MKAKELLVTAAVSLVTGFMLLTMVGPTLLTPSTASSSSDAGALNAMRKEIAKLKEQVVALGGGDDATWHVGQSPPAMPSVRVSAEEDEAINRKIYGGVGDKAHLGGFTDIDPMGISPGTWRWILEDVGVKSVVDVGCGKGVSTLWFAKQKVETLCVEGSHDAVTQSLLEPDTIVEHDFSRGMWWPAKTYDMVWCVELTEHVGRQFVLNYLPIFEQAAFIFVSHSNWGGWHHVEVHPPSAKDRVNWWWRARMEAHGFIFSEDLTNMLHEVAVSHQSDKAADGTNWNGQHIKLSMEVYINPRVASLRKHHHLIGGPGCFAAMGKPLIECEGPDVLPASYRSLPFNQQAQDEWEEQVLKGACLARQKQDPTIKCA